MRCAFLTVLAAPGASSVRGMGADRWRRFRTLSSCELHGSGARRRNRETMHSAPTVKFKRLLGSNYIFTLDEATGVLPRSNVLQDDVAW